MSIDTTNLLEQLSLFGLSLPVLADLCVHSFLIGKLASCHFATLLDFSSLILELLLFLANLINLKVDLIHLGVEIVLGWLLKPCFFGWKRRNLSFSGKNDLGVLLLLAVVELELPGVDVLIVAFVLVFVSWPIVAFGLFVLLVGLAFFLAAFDVCSLWTRLVLGLSFTVFVSRTTSTTTASVASSLRS